MVVPGPVHTGKEVSCSENVLLSIVLMSTLRSVFVVSLGWGLRPDSMLTMTTELTEEKRPA
jgi:hypothetical protein